MNLSDIRSQIVTKALETDDLTYARVAPYQACDRPLIPSVNASRQLEWTIEMGAGSIYNPSTICGMYAKEIKVRYGARINASVNSKEEIIIESGISKMGPTMILGSVTSEGSVFVTDPVSKRSDHQPGPVVIYGNIYGNNVVIKGKANILGSIIASEDVVIEGSAMVSGVIYSKNGRINIKDTEAYSIIAGGKAKKKEMDIWERDSLLFGIEIGGGVILKHPLIWLKDKEDGIKIHEHVEIKISNKKLPQKFSNVRLSQEDIRPFRDGLVVSRNWRSLSEDPRIFNLMESDQKGILKRSKNFEELVKAFTKDEGEGYLTLDDTGTKIINQHYGDNISISDSVINRSEIGGSRSGGRARSDAKVGSNIRIDESIVNRSDVGDTENEDDEGLFERKKYRKSRVEISDSILNRKKKLE